MIQYFAFGALVYIQFLETGLCACMLIVIGIIAWKIPEYQVKIGVR